MMPEFPENTCRPITATHVTKRLTITPGPTAALPISAIATSSAARKAAPARSPTTVPLESGEASLSSRIAASADPAVMGVHQRV